MPLQKQRVSRPEDAYWAFDPFAVVKPGHDWYEDLSARLSASRYGLGARLANHLRPSPNAPEHVQVAVLGQSGIGKTTQVRGAIGDMPMTEVFPVFLDAQTEFDQADLDFADVIFTLARAVLETLKTEEIDIAEEASEQLEDYFADETFVTTSRQTLSASLETEASANAHVPFVASLLAKFRASMKAESDYRREVRRRVQRDPNELIRRVNFLLDQAQTAVQGRFGLSCKLLVVVDNLEKFEDRSLVERAVISRAAELRELRCHLVVFLHPADLYAPRLISAKAAFQKVITMPALPIRNRTDPIDQVDQACIEAVKALLDRRVVADELFEDADAAVEALLRLSGGHLREVLTLAREACELFTGPQVGVAEIEAAARRLSRTHNAKIRPGDWTRLRDIAENKDIVNDPVDGYLLLHLLVLEYNGESWWDVHPYVRLDRRFQASSQIESP